jgi:hypothetical protein
MMDGAKSVTAAFTKIQHALSATKTGTGDGSVSSSPVGIDCGATCSAEFDLGAEVTLTTTPDGTSTFTGWSGACGGTGSCVVTMDTAKSATATFTTFTVIQYALSVTKIGTGGGSVSSSPVGIDCGATCSEVFDVGTEVTLTATADGTSTFTGWSGACGGTGSCVVTMDAAKSVSAAFTKTQHALSVTKTGTGTGTLTSTPAGIACGSTCSAAFLSGTPVTLTPAPAIGSVFSGWSGDADCADGAVTMNVDRSCTASFTKTHFEETDLALSYSGTWSNYICPACSGGTLKYSTQTGARVTFSFTGTGIKWVLTKANVAGKARIYLDGVNMGSVDLYSASTVNRVVLSKTGLVRGPHTVILEVTGQKSAGSTGPTIDIDAFDVVP